MATDDDFDPDFFGDSDHEAEPQEMRGGRAYANVIVVGPRVGPREYEARYSGIVPIFPISFVEEADTGEAHETPGDAAQIAICQADNERRRPLIEAARKLDLAEGGKK